MDTPQMLDFVKALADPDRLRIIGALSQGPLTASRVAEQTGLSFRKAVNHLAFLSHVGLLQEHAAAKKQDDVYELDAAFLEKLARRQLEGGRAAYTPPADSDDNVGRVLAAYLNPDGTVSQIPMQAAKLRVILNYLINAFEVDRPYTEKEVNAMLERFHADYIGLRRDLVDAGLLARERDGSRYWRPSGTEIARPL